LLLKLQDLPVTRQIETQCFLICKDRKIINPEGNSRITACTQ
jgi:hypothetical protein